MYGIKAKQNNNNNNKAEPEFRGGEKSHFFGVAVVYKRRVPSIGQLVVATERKEKKGKEEKLKSFSDK